LDPKKAALVVVWLACFACFVVPVVTPTVPLWVTAGQYLFWGLLIIHAMEWLAFRELLQGSSNGMLGNLAGTLLFGIVHINEVRAEAERGLHPYADRVRAAGLAATEVTREGPPAQVTLDEAERLHADMIVIGAAGRHALRDLLRGRITEHVVAHASCPVLTVKTH